MQSKKGRSILINALVLFAILALSFYLAHLVPGNEAVKEAVTNYGYAGIFLMALVSGFNLIVPIPAVAFLPIFIEAGLSFWITIAVITLGVSIADSLAYFLTRAGKNLVSHSFGEGVFAALHKIRDKHYKLPLFIFFIFASVAPLPNEILVAPLVLLGYEFKHILPTVLAGNFIFNLLYSQGVLGLYQTI